MKKLLCLLICLAMLLSLAPAALGVGITLVETEPTDEPVEADAPGGPQDEDLIPLVDTPNGDSGSCGENLSWTYSSGTLTISGTGPMTDEYAVVLPGWSSYREQIERVVVEEGVTSIGLAAFESTEDGSMYPKLKEVVLADSVQEIGAQAFRYCRALSKLTLGKGLTKIGQYAFYQCEKLGTAIFPDGLTWIGSRAFSGTGLSSVVLPDSVCNVLAGAFGDCTALKKAVVGAGVVQIQGSAFYGCSALETVWFMGPATDIGQSCFAGVTATVWYPSGSWPAAKRLNYDGTLTWKSFAPSGSCGENMMWWLDGSKLIVEGDGAMDDYTGSGETPWANIAYAIQGVYVGPGKNQTVGSYAWNTCYNLRSVEFAPDSDVWYIGDYAFCFCSSLEKLALPESVRNIGEYAFAMCALKRLALPGEIWEIGDGAFAFDLLLESVTINHVNKEIGAGAFSYCSALENVYFTGFISKIADDAFQSVTANAYYPTNWDYSWTAEKRRDYGGTLTWNPLPQPILYFESMDTDGIRLSWTAVPGAARYEVVDQDWNAEGYSVEPVANSWGDAWRTDTNSILIPAGELYMGAKYSFHVHAVGEIPSDYSDQVDVTFQPFTDVSGKKTLEYLSWAFNWGIVRGTSKTSFSPDAPCTRIQFVMMLWKMCGSQEVSGKNPFKDISGSKTTKAILWALDRGAINSAEYFHPDDPISRVQIVMILWKLEGSPEVTGTLPFKDVKGAKTQKAVNWAYQYNITKGTDATHFSPNAPCTRIQLVVFLYKWWDNCWAKG